MLFRYLAAFACGICILCSNAAWSAQADPEVLLVTDKSRPAFSDKTAEILGAHIADLPLLTIEVEVDMKGDPVELLYSTIKETECVAAVYVKEVEGGIIVYIAGARDERILIRVVQDPVTATALENAAVIVSSSLEALMQGENIGSGIKEYLRSKRAVNLGFAISYTVEAISETPCVMHGPAIGIELLLRRIAFVSIGARFPLPANVEESGVKLTLTRFPVELGGGLFLRFGKYFSFAPGLFVTLEYFMRKATSLRPDVTVNPDEDSFLVALGPAAEARITIKERWGFFIKVSGQFYVTRLNHAAWVRDEKITILSTWRLRPVIYGGFSFLAF